MSDLLTLITMKQRITFLFEIFFAFLFGFLFFCGSAFAFTATGEWTFSDPNAPQSGTIRLTFPAEGGSTDGHMTGGSSQFSLSYEAFLEGEFTGGIGGTFDGTLIGGITYTWVDPRNGQSVPTQKDFTGTWSGKLNKDGTIPISISSEGSTSSFTINFSVDDFKTEAEVSVTVPEPDLLNPVKEGEWVSGIKQCYEAYAIIDGKEVRIDTDAFKNSTERLPFKVEPGMIIKTKYKQSEALIELPDGSEVYLQGEGSEAMILPGNTYEDSNWHAQGLLEKPGTFVLMKPGTMLVRYKTGDKTGSWQSGSEDLTVDGTDEYKNDMMGVAFWIPHVPSDPSELADAIGNVGGLRDFGNKAPPLEVVLDEPPADEGGFWGLIFENESVVEYDYDGENATVKVYEGQVTVTKVDFKMGKTVEVAKVPAGESFQVNLRDFFKNDGEKGFNKTTFSPDEKSSQVKEFLKKSPVGSVSNGFIDKFLVLFRDNWIVVTVTIAFVILVILFFVRKKSVS